MRGKGLATVSVLGGAWSREVSCKSEVLGGADVDTNNVYIKARLAFQNVYIKLSSSAP
jgi:hypothetical protein